MNACTVIARHDLPAARVLARSFLDQHPGAAFTVLLIDDRADEITGDDEPFEVVRPSELALAVGELERLALTHDEAGLAAALTPALLRVILAQGARSALFLAPDVCVYAPLDDLGELAEQHGMVLVSRLTRAPSGDDLDGDAMLRGGRALDDGVIAVGRSHAHVLDWWQERLARPEDPVAWLDLAPGMFGARVVRDSACQVAAWNLSGREVRRTDDGYEIDDRVLRTFRFRGYHPDRPQLLPRPLGPPIVLGERPDLDALVGEYGGALRAAGWDQKHAPYGYGVLPGGDVVDGRMRELYREAVRDALEDGHPLPPNPFADGGDDAFVRWLNELVFPPLEPTLSRYLARLWFDSDDLRQRFPSLVGRSVDLYLEWILVIGAEERQLPACVLPAADIVERRSAERRSSRPRGPNQPGVNLFGYLDAVSGIGEVGRVLVDTLRGVGVSVAAVSSGVTLSPRESGTARAGPPSEARHDVNLLCCNAAQTPEVAGELGPEFFAGRRTIGLWFWEVEDFAIPSHGALDLVDEIWVASDFTRDAIASVSPKPVRTVPIPIRLPMVPASISRRALGLPEDRFVFYYSFDFLSVPERKNPVGTVDVFTRAFEHRDGPVLVLKSINGEQRPAALQAVREAARGRSDVVILDGHVSPEHQAALVASCDAYVSLHRSEGFGLTIAEAMGLGKPVIATGYSGNLEFMDDGNSYLVEYAMRPIGPGLEPYAPTSRWAEPDRDHAAALMRAVVANPMDARARGQRAAERIRSERSVEVCAPQLSSAIANLRRAPAGPATWRAFFMRGWRVDPGFGRVRRYEYDWLPDGTPFDDLMQHMVRGGDTGAGAAPDPENAAAFLTWLNEPVVPAHYPVVSRYLYELWTARPDLQRHFPDLKRNPGAYLAWMHEHGHDETDMPFQLIPTRDVVERAARTPPEEPSGQRGVAHRMLRAAYRAARRLRPSGEERRAHGDRCDPAS